MLRPTRTKTNATLVSNDNHHFLPGKEVQGRGEASRRIVNSCHGDGRGTPARLPVKEVKRGTRE